MILKKLMRTKDFIKTQIFYNYKKTKIVIISKSSTLFLQSFKL